MNFGTVLAHKKNLMGPERKFQLSRIEFNLMVMTIIITAVLGFRFFLDKDLWNPPPLSSPLAV